MADKSCADNDVIYAEEADTDTDCESTIRVIWNRNPLHVMLTAVHVAGAWG